MPPKLEEALDAHAAGLAPWMPGELEAAMGPEGRLLRPWIGDQPAMNLHFVPVEVLASLVAAPGLGAVSRDPSGLAEWIVRERRLGEVRPEAWRAMASRHEGPCRLLSAYLGTRTWVWRIRVCKGVNEAGRFLYVPPP